MIFPDDPNPGARADCGCGSDGEEPRGRHHIGPGPGGEALGPPLSRLAHGRRVEGVRGRRLHQRPHVGQQRAAHRGTRQPMRLGRLSA